MGLTAPFPVAARVMYSRGAPCVGWVSPFVHDEARCCGHASRWSWSRTSLLLGLPHAVDAGPLVAGGLGLQIAVCLPWGVLGLVLTCC